jgi:membrane protein DedA with SNARE-associated domain
MVALLGLGASVFEIRNGFAASGGAAIGSISQIFGGLTDTLLASGYAGLFALMLLESMALPIPSEVFLPMAGYLIFAGKMSFVGALTVTTAGGLIGSLVIFYIALILGRPVVYSLAGKFGVSNESLMKSEKWLSGKGSIAVFIARFLPGVRSSISIPAGALKMNTLRFSIVTVLGSLGWSLVLIYLGYAAGTVLKTGAPLFSSVMSQILIYAIAAISVSYVLYYIVARLSRRKAVQKIQS